MALWNFPALPILELVVLLGSEVACACYALSGLGMRRDLRHQNLGARKQPCVNPLPTPTSSRCEGVTRIMAGKLVRNTRHADSSPGLIEVVKDEEI